VSRYGSGSHAGSRYGSGSRGGSAYGGGPRRGKAKGNGGGGGGVLSHLGVAGNLIGDVKDAAMGAVVAPYYLATHPVRTVEDLAKSTGAYYGPLFTGDIRQFGRNVYDHPLNIILDAATIATLGGASEVRAYKLLADAGMVSREGRLAKLATPSELTLRSPGARAGEDFAATITRRTSENPVIRARKEAVAHLLDRLPYDLPVLGEQARFWRAARRDPHARAEVLRQAAGPYMDAYGKLNKSERRALGLLARVPIPDHLEAWRQMLVKEADQGNHDAAHLLETISDEKVMTLYRDPSKKMLAAHAEAAKLGDESAATLERLGVLSHQDAEAAKYRHSRIAAGADVYTPQTARAAARQLAKTIRLLERHQETIDKQIQTLRPRRHRLRIHAGRAELPRLQQLEQTLEAKRDQIAPGIVGGPTVDELRAQIDAGRPAAADLHARRSRRGRRSAERGGGAFSYGAPSTAARAALHDRPARARAGRARPAVPAHRHLLALPRPPRPAARLRDRGPEGRQAAAGWVWVKRPSASPTCRRCATS
jgi:hypothetical protein